MIASELTRGFLTQIRALRHSLGLLPLLLIVAAFMAPTTGWTTAQDTEEPELSLRATPRVGFVPAEILFIGELRGGSDDHQPLYCAGVEWAWDDGTHSERSPDCDPYEPGTSEIRRRFSRRHTFQHSGRYEVRLSLKRRDEVISSARTTIEVRGGFR